MNFKKILISLSVSAVTLTSFAETDRDKVVFEAMREEMNRTRNMQMDQKFPTPFFVGYYLKDSKSMQVTSKLGSVISSDLHPLTSEIGAEIYIGSREQSNKADFSGRIASSRTTSDNNPIGIRNSFWSMSDVLYKNSIKEIQAKINAMQQMQLSPEEKKLTDMFPMVAVKDNSSFGVESDYDVKKWEDICNKLSAIFLKYPDLSDSSVSFGANSTTFYILNTEGTEIKQNYNYVSLTASASIQAEDGSMYSSDTKLFSLNEDKLPSNEELEKKINDLAKKLVTMKNTPAIDEYYNGPVMFIDGAVPSVLLSPVVSNIIAYKGLSQKGWNFNPAERKIGNEVIDSKLTVKNYTNKKEYNGEQLIGYYDIDAEGVKPTPELTCIEKGELKNMLLGNSETTIIKNQTGSTRMAIGRGISKVVMPSTLHVYAEKGTKHGSMKKALLKLAKSKKHKYAYIIANMSGMMPEVYKVDVKTGVETLVSSVALPQIDNNMVNKIPYISSDDQVINAPINNVLMSLIMPKAIILNDVKLDVVKNENKLPEPFMPSPLKRTN